MLDQAPARREVEHVEAVDRRRDDQHRHLVHLGGRRPVLDQLEDVGAQHDRPRARRQVLADREAAGVDAGRQARRARDVAHERPRAACQVRPAVVDDLPQHRRVGEREVRRRERIQHVAGREARLSLVAPVELGVGDQAVDRGARREVRLQQRAQQRVRLPRAVGEAPVAGGRAQLGPAAGRARELGAEAVRAGRGPPRPAREAGHGARGCAGRQEPAPTADGGVGEQDVERPAGRSRGTHLAAACSGTSIARLRILPVAPFGSSSTNHTWRGYL